MNSDEPRETSVGWKEHRRTVDPVERARMEAYANVGRLTTDENVFVIAAVLAEVARRDAGGAPRLSFDDDDEIGWAIARAAEAIREAMRLKAGDR